MDQLSRQQYMIERYNEFIQYKMNHKDALYVIRLMFELNSLGFERYVSDYFHKRDEYTTKVVGGWNDHGIDIEGSKTIGHRAIHLAVQCKKWYYPHTPVKKDKILEFEDNVKRREKTHDNTKSFFVTTTNASKEAKRVAQEKGITIKDCRDLIKMREFYSLDVFITNTKKRNNNGDRLFTPDNPTAVIHNYLNGKRRIFYPIS